MGVVVVLTDECLDPGKSELVTLPTTAGVATVKTLSHFTDIAAAFTAFLVGALFTFLLCVDDLGLLAGGEGSKSSSLSELLFPAGVKSLSSRVGSFVISLAPGDDSLHETLLAESDWFSFVGVYVEPFESARAFSKSLLNSFSSLDNLKSVKQQ
jgi:hypothetical protein